VNARRFYRLAPAHVLEQTVAWRQEAIQRALADPDSAKRYRLSLTAEAFRTMPPVLARSNSASHGREFF